MWWGRGVKDYLLHCPVRQVNLSQQISENYTTYYENPPNIWKMTAVTLLDTLGHTPMPSVSIKSGSGV